MDVDAAELLRRRRDELLSELAVLSEALRRLMEIEEEAEPHDHHAAAAADGARFAAYGAEEDNMAAAGTHHRDDDPAAVAAVADDHRTAPDHDNRLWWLDYIENVDDDDDIWWDDPVHQAVATGRLYVPRSLQSTSASLDSNVQAYAYHHGGGGAPAMASNDDDSPYFLAAGDDPPSDDEPEHPMHHLEHHMHDDDSFSTFGPEMTPFRSSDDGSFGTVPVLRKQRYDGTGADSGCVICFRDFKRGRRLAVMPCAYGHRFHRKCLRKWLNSSNVCPLCRYALPTE